MPEANDEHKVYRIHVSDHISVALLFTIKGTNVNMKISSAYLQHALNAMGLGGDHLDQAKGRYIWESPENTCAISRH